MVNKIDRKVTYVSCVELYDLNSDVSALHIETEFEKNGKQNTYQMLSRKMTRMTFKKKHLKFGITNQS